MRSSGPVLCFSSSVMRPEGRAWLVGYVPRFPHPALCRAHAPAIATLRASGLGHSPASALQPAQAPASREPRDHQRAVEWTNVDPFRTSAKGETEPARGATAAARPSHDEHLRAPRQAGLRDARLPSAPCTLRGAVTPALARTLGRLPGCSVPRFPQQ